ncbi:MAG: glycoside hydrolase family 2 protein [Suilimivivens sp.]
MLKYTLNGNWNLKITGKDSSLLPAEGIVAKVPGSVYSALLEEELIPDPFYRDNELKVLPLMDNDFSFCTCFVPEEELFSCDEVILRFDGIDTLADVYLNGELLGSAYNMHRIWEFDVLSGLKRGENELKVVLHSPTRYIKEENEKVYTGGSHECMEGFPHIRKAHCMFGWDWGPRIPDAGIFREVSLLGIKESRIDSVYISQIHEEGKVTLDFDVALELFIENDNTKIEVKVISPSGKVYTPNLSEDGEDYRIEITDPEIWWPRGYGKQPLYQAKVSLLSVEGEILDTWEKKIGLRTITVNTDQDQWGNSFAHEVNGVKIFAMGADYIPEDNILSRVTRERTERLLKDAAEANHNCIRVWGGGYYPDDCFFETCDELGLLVWQDFMFACASYELDDEFERNVTQEIIDNVRRIRHHACLALWCGNNEMETQTLDKAWKPSIKQKYDYIKLYEYIIPKILKEEDPAAFYWPSSPSSGGNYDNPWDENRGDTHYWDVWHGNKPFTEYRKFRFRYLSEFGFQSFPCLKTVESFTLPEDRNIFSRIMEMHQRNCAANGKILNYLSATYLYPKDFESLLYASQLLQADAIRYGVEHFRRYRGRCMGTVVWQLNDIWPVASWASIDYYGRWKALHYAEKKMFAPVLISCEETGELSERPYCISEPAPIEKSARLHVANETMEEVRGVAKWQLCGPDSRILESGSFDVTVPALDGVWLEKLDFSKYDERKIHLSYQFLVEDRVVSENSCLFTPPKHYYFQNPDLTLTRKGDILIVTAKNYAKNVSIEGVDGEVKLSDNFFDMEAGVHQVEILEGNAAEFRCRSVYDIA